MRGIFATMSVAATVVGMAMTAGPGNAADLDVTKYGAVGDGSTDCTAAFQTALDESGKAGGGIVTVPTGQFRINGNLVVPGGVTLQGTFRVPPADRHDNFAKFNGSTLLAYAGRGKADGEPFIKLAGSMAAVAGLIVNYPEWKQTDVPPVPYPPCIMAQGFDNVGVIDCCLINPYEGIRFTGVGRFMVRNVYGYPCWRGFYTDGCFDIGRVENCHFWPFGVTYKADDPFCQWVNTHAVAFEFARTDWQYVLNTFCFGYGVGYKFSTSPNPTWGGGCNGNFLGLGADSCERSVLVEDAQMPGLLITNGEFVGRWGSKTAVTMEIGEKVQSKVSLTNCSFWGPIDRCVWQRGPKAQFTANACHFVDWAGPAAIQLDAGKAIIQGSTFMQKKRTDIIVGGKVKSAIIIGNQSENGLRVDNKAGSKTQLIGNEQD